MPKYIQIAKILQEKIYNDEFAETKKLPTEDELIEMFKVSRNTVRRTIETLVKQGLVIPIQGSGVFIRENPEEGAISLEGFHGLTAGFRDAKIDSKLIKFELTAADEHLAQKMGCEVGTPVYYIERVRHLNDKPYVYEMSYFNKNVIPYLSEEIILKSIYKYITEDLNKQLGYVYREIFAGKVPAKVAKEINLKAGDPALITENSAMLKSGVIFDYSLNYHHYENARFLKLSNFI